MIRLSIALGLLCITGLGCRGRAPEAAAMSEPPPPLIEPELAPHHVWSIAGPTSSYGR